MEASAKQENLPLRVRYYCLFAYRSQARWILINLMSLPFLVDIRETHE
jgi:hypothetical protein